MLDKPPGYKIICEPETIHFQEANKSVVNTISFYLEDYNLTKISFNGETLTFPLQLVTFHFHAQERAFKNLKRIVIVLGVHTDLPQQKFRVK